MYCFAAGEMRNSPAARVFAPGDCGKREVGFRTAAKRKKTMKSWWKVLTAVIVCGTLGTYASAASYGEYHARHSINARQREQQRRISQGIENGSLSRREAGRLEREQYRFGREEARLRQGGLTTRERDRLEDQQDRMSRQIYRQKHDRDRR